jgi:hypothetical protein
MTIPRRHSRPLDVDGRKFRYMINAKPRDLEAGPDDRKITLTIQEDTEDPGRVLQTDLPHGVPVTPLTIAGIVRRALKAPGTLRWDPSERGEAFRASFRYSW